MKLLYITNGITAAGGLERVLSVKASFFADIYNYDVFIITLNEEGKQCFYSFSPKIKIINIQIKSRADYLNKYILGISKIVRQLLPDIISVCDDGLKGLFVPLWLRRGYKKIIYERHVSQLVLFGNNLHSMKYKIYSYFMSLGAKKYDKFVVLTSGNKNEWRGLKNIVVIPNPLPIHPDQTSPLNSKYLIAVGRLEDQKGYNYMLKIWEKVCFEFPDWNLKIYGTGSKKEEILEYIKEHELIHIDLCEPVIDIEQEYIASSIFVLTSKYEGFGMVLIEAMSCGLPCISFGCPCGPSDIIENNVNGYLIPSYDIEEYVYRLKKLMKDETLRICLGKKAISTVERYAPDKVCKTWVSLFSSLLGQ